MSAVTKKHRTDMIEVSIGGEQGRRFVGPRAKVKPLLRLLNDGGFVPLDTEHSAPWRKVFTAEIEKYGEPAMALKGLRLREGWTQAQLAHKLAIAHYNISKMENGTRPIGKKMAMRLAKVLGTDYRVFL